MFLLGEKNAGFLIQPMEQMRGMRSCEQKLGTVRTWLFDPPYYAVKKVFVNFFAKFFEVFAKFFKVFASFLRFSRAFRGFRIHSDPLGCIRMHSEAIGSVWTFSNFFEIFWIFESFFNVSGHNFYKRLFSRHNMHIPLRRLWMRFSFTKWNHSGLQFIQSIGQSSTWFNQFNRFDLRKNAKHQKRHFLVS